MPKSPLSKLAKVGQSVWIDYLSRDLVHQGGLQGMMDANAVTGVTSNPTIFQKAVSQGTAYDAQLRELAGEKDAKEVFLALAKRDIQDACDVLRPVWEKTKGVDGYVSMEVDPTLAWDTEATFAEAMRIHQEFDRPNLLVKIPATMAGLPAIEDMIAHGRSINITLIFSLERYAAVVEAYLRGLERLIAGGGDPTRVSSVASFFVSRVDTETDRRLEEIGAPDKLRGKLGIANAKLAYEHFQRTFAGERWNYLAGKGARTQRCLWASTSTKNPAYRDVMYVEGLIGPDTVNTMPEETIEAFQDHGEVEETLAKGVGKAHQLLADLEQAGVDYDDVVATLEDEGVEKFSDSFAELLDGIRAKRGDLVGA
jgi:transaldolase